MELEWRDVVGYAGHYSVSNFGHIYSHKRKRELQPGKDNALVLCREGYKQPMQRAAIVLEAFVGPKPAGCWACHKDDNRCNNHVSNLYWGTPSSNMCDAYRNGGKKPVQLLGELNHKSSISEAQARSIKQLHADDPQKWTDAALAIHIGCSLKVVRDILLNRRWKHIVL